MKAALLALALVLAALPACSQPGAAADPVLQVDFNNPSLTPSHWTLTVHPDGSGHFRSERGSAPVVTPQSLDAPNVDREIHLNAEFAQRLFQTAHQHNWAGAECESRAKVAFEGWKKISYSGPEGHGLCEFNYVSVAATILEGARLEMLLLHDRLGLDAELRYLTEAAKDGRVQQICAIRGILQRLAEDDSVMERVRRHARALLAKGQ